jgi:hypothetical protein
VSPQYHCQFNEAFQTVKNYDATFHPPSLWQEKAYFVESKRSEEREEVSERASLPAGTVTPPLATPEATVTDNVTERQITEQPDQTMPAPNAAEQGNNQTPNEPEGERHERVQEQDPPVIAECRTRAGRIIRLPRRYDDFVAFEALHIPGPEGNNRHPIIAFKASSDPDTMYYHEAMKAPDAAQFCEAMQKEMEDRTSRGHWEIMRREDLAADARVLPAVWSMKRKHRISTQEVYRWKARLTIDGSKQLHGVDYDQTYSPVVTWAATRFFLILSLIQNWHSRQLDFVLAYPQANIERDLHMEVPRGLHVPGMERGTCVLKLLKNLYGQKQAGRVWYTHLVTGLKALEGSCSRRQSTNAYSTTNVVSS